MGYQYTATPVVLYHADQNVVNTLRSIREHVLSICQMYMHQSVRIQTLDGRVVEGEIVGCDDNHVHIRLSHHETHRAYGPYSYTILTLVLYELLVIVLLATGG